MSGPTHFHCYNSLQASTAKRILAKLKVLDDYIRGRNGVRGDVGPTVQTIDGSEESLNTISRSDLMNTKLLFNHETMISTICDNVIRFHILLQCITILIY